MTATEHYECALVQADGRFDLEKDPHNYGDSTDLFAAGGNGHFALTTTPNSKWWDGSDSSLEISQVSAAAKIMTFRGNI